MALYNIALRTDTHVRDVLRVERDDLTGLRIEMARFVGELLKDHAEQIWVDEDWRVDVTDEDGLILYVMQIPPRNQPLPCFRPLAGRWGRIDDQHSPSAQSGCFSLSR